MSFVLPTPLYCATCWIRTDWPCHVHAVVVDSRRDQLIRCDSGFAPTLQRGEPIHLVNQDRRSKDKCRSHDSSPSPSDERHAPSPGALIKGRAARHSVSRCPPLPHLDYFGLLRNSAQARRRRCSPRVVTRVEARPSGARAPRDVQVSSWRPAPRSTADLPRSTA